MVVSRFPRWSVTPLLVVGLTLAGGCGGPPSRSTTGGTSVTPPAGSTQLAKSSAPKADVTVTAEQLVKDYAADEKIADEKYKGKSVRVSGTFDKLTTDSSGVAKVNFKSESEVHVECGIPADAVSKAKALRPGEKVTLQGKCFGLLVIEVVISSCDFVE